MTGVAAGDIEAESQPDPEAGGTTKIDTAIKTYLLDVKATKKESIHRTYKTALVWFRKHCKKHLVSKIDRSDIVALFAAGRDESLAQATINKHVLSYCRL
jgi:hypothetical protein